MGNRKRRPHRRVVGRLLVTLAVIVPVLTLFSTVSLCARRNHAQFVNQVSGLDAAINRDEARGVPPEQLNSIRRRLILLEGSRVGPIPANWLGKRTTASQLTSLTQATKQVWSADVANDRTTANRELAKLNAAEGTHLIVQQDDQALTKANTPIAIQALTQKWTSQLRQWTNAEAKLKKLGGGLTNGEPSDVAALESSLLHLLSANRTNQHDVEQGQAAIAAAKLYLQETPSEQITQHANIIAQLHSSISTLQRDTIPDISISDGLFDSQFSTYIRTREDSVSVAIYDANNGKTYLYNPNETFDTASIVKVSILADLLHESHGQPLTTTEQQLMPPMIEESDNSAATTLWNLAGGDAGIQSFLKQAGLTHTTAGAGGQWGLTETTAIDQVDLVKLLAYPNPVLTDAERTYGLNLMEHVTSWEDWGVSSGAAANATVALKNGWLPYPAQWWVNSIGYINGDGRNYTIAILSEGNASEQYGIQTDDAISTMVWDALGGD